MNGISSGGDMANVRGMSAVWSKTWEEAPRFAPGAPADLGVVSEGGRTIRATLEERAE